MLTNVIVAGILLGEQDGPWQFFQLHHQELLCLTLPSGLIMLQMPSCSDSRLASSKPLAFESGRKSCVQSVGPANMCLLERKRPVLPHSKPLACLKPEAAPGTLLVHLHQQKGPCAIWAHDVAAAILLGTKDGFQQASLALRSGWKGCGCWSLFGWVLAGVGGLHYKPPLCLASGAAPRATPMALAGTPVPGVTTWAHFVAAAILLETRDGCNHQDASAGFCCA